MKIRDQRRQDIAATLADYILDAGLQGASLRPLAAACGVSDRMLLYYFADKNELLTVTLGEIAARLTAILDTALPGVHSHAVLLPRVRELLASDSIQPYMRLWLELVALAARKQEPFDAIAGQLCDGFLAWTAARLKVDREADRQPLAALLLATVEGLILLDAIGRESAARAALKGARLTR